MRAGREKIVCLLIDEARRELLVVLPGEDDLQGLGTRADDRVLFRVKLDDLATAPRGKAEELLGGRALGAFAHLGQTDIGYRGYKYLADEAELILEKDRYSRAADGGPEVLFELALQKMFEATHHGDAVLLDATEEYLNQAAAQGYERAKRFLAEVWPTEREFRQKLIDERHRRSSKP